MGYGLKKLFDKLWAAVAKQRTVLLLPFYLHVKKVLHSNLGSDHINEGSLDFPTIHISCKNSIKLIVMNLLFLSGLMGFWTLFIFLVFYKRQKNTTR